MAGRHGRWSIRSAFCWPVADNVRACMAVYAAGGSSSPRRHAKWLRGILEVRVPDTGRSDEMGQLREILTTWCLSSKKARPRGTTPAGRKAAVVGRLGSAIAHEIRNPLNYINLTLDHLRSEIRPEDAEKRRDVCKN